jgi:N-hydroxyarylamine O-acetyltransferase
MEWNMDERVLAAYLGRIGVDGPLSCDRATLNRIVLRHALSIPFENLDAFTGTGVDLQPAAVEHKLIHRRRGGWCFEHNLLLGNALQALGFEVEHLAARVLWGRAATDRTPRTHRLLCVRCEGVDHLADAGFGAGTPTAALVLGTRDAQATPHEMYRLGEIEDDLMLEVRAHGQADGSDSWLPLYRFDLRPQWPEDFEAANFQLAHDPTSFFVNQLVLARPAPGGRHALRGNELVWRELSGHSEHVPVTDAVSLHRVLRQVFDIEAPDPERLSQRFLHAAEG